MIDPALCPRPPARLRRLGVVLALLAAAAPARAQEADLRQIWQQLNRDKPISALEKPPLSREPRATPRRRNTPERTYAIPEPLLSERGERLVAVVDEIQLSAGDLGMRIEMFMKNNPPSYANMTLEEQMELLRKNRQDLAQNMLDGWVVNTVLTVEAVGRGHRVTDREVDEHLARLGREVAGSPDGAEEAVRIIGIPVELLRKEARDGLLIEKFITSVMRDTYSESDYKRAYKLGPSFFRDPPRVRAFHVILDLSRSWDARRRRGAEKEMARLRKKIRKAEPEAFAQIVQKSSKSEDLLIGDSGWIPADAPLTRETYRALFGHSVGETSDVYVDRYGLHLVRILDREEGTPRTYEAARPQIESWLYEKTKFTLYDLVRANHTIRMNAGGLNRWREATREEYQAYVRRTASAAVPEDPREARLRALRRRQAAAKPPAEKPPALPGAASRPAIDLDVLGPAERPPAGVPPRPAPPQQEP